MKELIKNLKKTWNYNKGCKKILIKFIIGVLLLIIYNVGMPVLIGQSIIYLTDNLFEKLILISIGIFIIDILAGIIDKISNQYAETIFLKNIVSVSTDFSKTILNLTNETLDKNGTGFFIRRMQDDTINIADILNALIYNMRSLLTGIGVFIFILIISPPCFIFFILISLFNYFYNKNKYKVYENNDKIYKEKNEKVTSFITEVIRGIRDIKMLNCENTFVDELSKRITDSNDALYNKEQVVIKYSFVGSCVLDLGDMLTIILLVYLILIGNLDIVYAIIIYNNYYMVTNFHGNVDWLMNNIKNFNISANRVFEIMEDEKFEKESFGNKVVDKLEGNIVFDKVNFSYKDNKVLNDLSFEIKPNKTYAITGSSGVGKTTIFNLISKMYDIDSGNILLDDYNINDLSRKSIRENITIISQNPYIFNLTIKENFKLIKENVSDKEIKEACKLACLDEFINELKDGYDTVLGEGGINLSGGQRQRLAIARALVQKTEIILFDEATSALDNVTEREITKAIDNLKGTYTIIIVAHRLSTIINSDEILYIEKGKVKAKGTHKELLKNSVEYKSLYEKEIIK